MLLAFLMAYDAYCPEMHIQKYDAVIKAIDTMLPVF